MSEPSLFALPGGRQAFMVNYNGPDLDFISGFVRGYRCWRLDTLAMQLWPIHRIDYGPWHEGVNKAQCSYTRGSSHYDEFLGVPIRTPAPECTCGFYATYDQSYRNQVVSRFDPKNGALQLVVHGSVRATGRVVLGTGGFRAEKAEIEGLYGSESWQIAQNLGVKWHWRYKKYRRKFPEHDLTTLLEMV